MSRSVIALAGLISTLVAAADPGPARAATAEENYRLYCVQCHGSTGNGEGINQTSGGLAVSPRNHAYAKQMSEITDDEIRRAITDGGDAVEKSELMPPWGRTLTAEEIDDLVRYLRKLCRCEANR
ncbi:MAG: c-type cytochrome [Paracoccaceae bacterium]